MDTNYIRERITELRIKKGVSEYKMSLDLGHSRSYIQSIAAGRSMPSMTEFLYLCDYLGVTPSQFFDDADRSPILVQKAIHGMKNLPEKDLLVLNGLIDRLNDK